MTFLFSLEAVLRLRRNVEERESQRLLGIDGQLRTARDAAAQARSCAEHARRQIQDEVSAGISGAELALKTQMIQSLDMAAAEAGRAADQLQRKRNEQLERVKHARMGREMLERLRERHLDAYRREASRREQRAADDLFLARRRKGRGAGAEGPE